MIRDYNKVEWQLRKYCKSNNILVNIEQCHGAYSVPSASEIYVPYIESDWDHASWLHEIGHCLNYTGEDNECRRSIAFRFKGETFNTILREELRASIWALEYDLSVDGEDLHKSYLTYKDSLSELLEEDTAKMEELFSLLVNKSKDHRKQLRWKYMLNI